MPSPETVVRGRGVSWNLTPTINGGECMDNNEIKKVLNELNEFDDNEVYNEYGWLITDEDDILDPWRNEKKLQEGLDVVDWTKVSPCDILYAETEVQHNTEIPKRRPLLTLYVNGNEAFGLQITGTAPGTGFRSRFKYALKDWTKVGLRKPSYINYDHIVKNVTNNVLTGYLKITQRDAKGLLECLERDYNDLIESGYKSTYDKELLDDFMIYLKHI